MKWRSMVLHVVIVLLSCSVLDTGGMALAGPAERSGWYVNVGAGMNWISSMKQKGWNQDTTCYPDDACTGQAPGGGYRWSYALDADLGSVLEIAVGRMFGDLRLDLSVSQQVNGMNQEFVNITYLDGSAITPAENSNYTQSSTATMDDLTTRTLLLNAYYDFPLAQSRITPYLGAGIGLSYVELSGLFFHSEYSCGNGCGRPAREYNSLQDTILSDTVFSGRLYVGADYSLNDRFLLGLKLSYSLVDDIADTSGYAEHPIPGLISRTEISGMGHRSLMLTLRYLFDD